jgi:hypothetical protein
LARDGAAAASLRGTKQSIFSWEKVRKMDCFAATRLAMTNLFLGYKMHIHIHNEADGLDDPITPAEVVAAGLAGHHITYGATAA